MLHKPRQDAQTISLAGNVLYPLVAVTVMLILQVLLQLIESQALSIVGNVISPTGGGSVDYTDARFDAYLKTETDSRDLSRRDKCYKFNRTSGNLE